MALAYINWRLSIVASAMLVPFVAKRQPQVAYRLPVACPYFDLVATWHARLSASSPLLLSTPGHFPQAQLGDLPIDRTLFSAFNLGLTAASVTALTFIAYTLHPSPERAVHIQPELLDKLDTYSPPERPADSSFAATLDHSRGLNLAFGLVGVVYL